MQLLLQEKESLKKNMRGLKTQGFAALRTF